MRALLATRYAGPDRRRPIPAGDVGSHVRRVVLVALAVLAGWTVVAAFAARQPEEVRLTLLRVTDAASGALLLGAAALRFAAWRIDGRARTAWSVVALALAGFAIPLTAAASRAAGIGSGQIPRSIVAGSLVELTLIAIAVAALFSPPVASGIRPLRMSAALVAWCALIAFVEIARGGADAASSSLSMTAAALRAAITVLWFAVAAGFFVSGRIRGRKGEILLGLALLAPCARGVVGVALGPQDYYRMFFPSGTQLLAGCLLVGASAVALWRLQAGQGTRLLTVAGELRGVRSELAHVEQDEARRLHDARNAILAVSGVLRIFANRIPNVPSGDGLDPAELRRLATAELERLGTLLDPGLGRVRRSFRLSAVVEPLVTSHRLAGSRIAVDLVDCQAVGQPVATATAIANLLSNARTHAPGAQVWLSSRVAGDDVEIVICDDGPGIPTGDRSAVLLPGVRGSQAAQKGTGIGLASAAQAMSEQGGTLRLQERPGGGTMITLTLRRDRRASVPDSAAPQAGANAAVAANAASAPPAHALRQVARTVIGARADHGPPRRRERRTIVSGRRGR